MEAMATASAMLNQLLDDIPAGNVPVFVAPPEGFRTVRLRLANSIIGNMDAFRPARAAMEKMLKDAALLSTLSQRDPDQEGVDIVHVAGLVHDLVDRRQAAPYTTRDQDRRTLAPFHGAGRPSGSRLDRSQCG